MYKKELPRVSPESEGISSKKIQNTIEWLEENVSEMHGFMVARNGKVISECWWSPYNKDLVHICHSFGKSYACTGIGLACSERLLSVDDHIVDIFSEEIEKYGVNVSENLRKLTVHHVLSMQDGMTRIPMVGPDFVKNFLQMEVDQEPGTQWLYNTAGSCLLVAIVEKVSGISIWDYMCPRVFQKIGIETDKIKWQKFRNGGTYAATGVSSTTENNLRLGMLYLNMGLWEGEQILDREWVQQATSKQADNSCNPSNPDPNGTSGYGYQLWLNKLPGVYRFDGGHGQFSIMCPRLNMVVSVNASGCHEWGPNNILDAVDRLFEEEYPDNLPENPENLASLREFERTRSLPLPESRPLSQDYRSWEGIYETTAGEFHLHPELRPFDTFNAYAVDFYDREDVNTKTISIRFPSESSCELVLDGIYRFDVRLDGTFSLVHTGSAYPAYYTTQSSGYFEGDTFVIHSRYLQTAFRGTMYLTKTDDGLMIRVKKDKLHEESPYFYMNAQAKKIL